MLGFFVAESNFYPGLDALCRQRVLKTLPKKDEDEQEVERTNAAIGIATI